MRPSLGQFNDATAFNAAIGGWDTSKVTTMDKTFDSADTFNRPLAWDTSKVTRMEYAFYEAIDEAGSPFPAVPPKKRPIAYLNS